MNQKIADDIAAGIDGEERRGKPPGPAAAGEKSAPSGLSFHSGSSRRFGKSKLTPTIEAMAVAKKRNAATIGVVLGLFSTTRRVSFIGRPASQPAPQAPGAHLPASPAMHPRLQGPCRWISYRFPAIWRWDNFRGPCARCDV